MTLGEAITQNGMGEGIRYKVADVTMCSSNYWFEPRFKLPAHDRFVGICDRGECDVRRADSPGWEYIKSEPKTVTRWMWACTDAGQIGWKLSAEAPDDGWIKLEWSATEFVEEES